MQKDYYSNEGSKVQSARVTILYTERRTVTSLIANEKYDLYLHFPHTYWNSEKQTKYPVLFVLHGQWDFSMMLGSFGNHNYDGLIPEIIVVGITWGGTENNDNDIDYHKMGFRDFTPVKMKGIDSGGADKFLSVLKEELIPFIESEYPVTNDRGLAGGSISGLFVLYSMLRETELFKRYIVSSPTVHWAESFIIDYETNFYKKNNILNTHLWISWGEYENSNFIRQFVSQVQSRNYQGLNMETSEVKGTGHAGNKPECFSRGLLFVYKRPELNFSNYELDRYVGQYLAENKRIEIKRNEKGLIFKWNNDPETQLFAESEFIFYVKGKYVFFYFHEADSIINQMKVELWDSEFIANKVIQTL